MRLLGIDLAKSFYTVNHDVQMGGRFRKEFKAVADLKGATFRVGGLAGRVLSKLGVVAQQIAAAEIFRALEKGTIDAALTRPTGNAAWFKRAFNEC